MATSPQVKDTIVNHTRAKMRDIYGEDLYNNCLHWAAMTAYFLQSAGQNALIQAGSCMWPRMRQDQDDGVSPTHFSYVFEVNALNISRYRQSMLPEMHVWVGLPDTKEIIDLTTCFWPQQCKELIGYNWPGQQPPDFLWCTPDQFPTGVSYKPDKMAMGMVLNFLIQLETK